MALTSKDNFQWTKERRKFLGGVTKSHSGHFCVEVPHLCAIMIYVFQKVSPNIKMWKQKQIFVTMGQGRIWCICPTKLLKLWFNNNFDKSFRTFQPWPPGMVPQLLTSSTLWQSDPVGLFLSRTMLSLRRWLTLTGWDNMFSPMCAVSDL